MGYRPTRPIVIAQRGALVACLWHAPSTWPGVGSNAPHGELRWGWMTIRKRYDELASGVICSTPLHGVGGAWKSISPNSDGYASHRREPEPSGPRSASDPLPCTTSA